MPLSRHRAIGSLGRSATVLLALLAMALTACAPNRMPPGPGPTEPRLELADSPMRVVAHDGALLPLRRWLPDGPEHNAPKAVILALHGFNDYSKAFETPGRWWASQGFAVYAYDQRGFGETEHPGLWAGTETLVEDVRTTSLLLQAAHPESPFFLLGESMGGAVALAALTRPGAPPVSGVVLSAPAVWARGTMPIHQRVALWLAERVMPGARFSGSGLKIQASDNIEMLRGLGRDPLVIKRTRVDAMGGLTDLMSEALAAGPALETPALVLYGDKDEIVPEVPTLAFWNSLPGVAAGQQRPVLYGEGWHMLLRDLQAKTVWADIVRWIDDRQAPLPSGADRVALGLLDQDRPDQLPPDSDLDKVASDVAGDMAGGATVDRVSEVAD